MSDPLLPEPVPGPVPEPATSPAAREALVMLIVVVLLAVAGGGAYLGLRRTDELAAVSAGSTGSCDPVVTRETDRNLTHRAPADLDYSAGPPSFGEHLPSPAPFGRAFYTAADRPAVGNLVHSMEHGFTIAWYDETAAADTAAMAGLRELADQLAGQDARFIAVPWTAKDGAPFPDGRHYTLTRWSADAKDPGDTSLQRGNWLYCGELDRKAMTAFTEHFPNAESPEPGIGLPPRSPV